MTNKTLLSVAFAAVIIAAGAAGGRGGRAGRRLRALRRQPRRRACVQDERRARALRDGGGGAGVAGSVDSAREGKSRQPVVPGPSRGEARAGIGERVAGRTVNRGPAAERIRQPDALVDADVAGGPFDDVLARAPRRVRSCVPARAGRRVPLCSVSARSRRCGPAPRPRGPPCDRRSATCPGRTSRCGRYGNPVPRHIAAARPRRSAARAR